MADRVFNDIEDVSSRFQRRFKAPNGVYYTKQLFFETADSSREFCLYTLKDRDHEGSFTDSVTGESGTRLYPSLRRLFLEIDDPSEYTFAIECFDSWSHYKKLLQCSWFVDYLTEYREERDVREAARALLEIRNKARTGDIPTNKYLLEKGWISKDKSSVGRPTKERIKREAERIFETSGDISEDLKRISEGMTFQ